VQNYVVVIHEEPGGGFWGEVPSLPGCYSQGETVNELKHNIREAIAGVLEVSQGAGRVTGFERSDSGRGRLKSITGAEMCRLIEANGWILRRINGSHHSYSNFDSCPREQGPSAASRA
jgi:predicted RNase H-like HicB family nuclease